LPIPTNAFEITTGAVAFDAPFGPTVQQIAMETEVKPGVSLFDLALKIYHIPDVETFDQLPVAEKDKIMRSLVNIVM
jgi:hypothetical protein